jgi:hypothetical protein
MAKKFLSDIELDAGLVDVNGNTGTSGQILSSTGTGVDWISQDDITAGQVDKALSLTLQVKNTESVALTKGQVVCAAPTATPPSGNVIEVKLADNNGTDSMPVIGILNEGLDAAGGANDEGEAIMFGRISGIDTSAFSVGDEVFVSDTPGGLTATKPTGVKYIQKVGVIMRDDASNGTIEVFGAGRTNDVPTPLYIDHANQRLGIRKTSPSSELHINNDSALPQLTLSNAPATGYGGGGKIIIEGGTNDFVYGSIEFENGGSRDARFAYSAASREMSFRVNERGISGQGYFRFYNETIEIAEINASGIYGNVFYDQGNSGYYVNPASTGNSFNALGYAHIRGGITTDGSARSYTWRALDNTASSSTRYQKIARITSSQSSRFIIELAGRSTSYDDVSLPAMGYIVGQLNNDNNYDLVFYNHSGEDTVVDEVGQVDVSTTATDIYIKVSFFSEVTAHAHISDGTIAVDSTSAGSTEPSDYIAATNITVWNSRNDGSGSGLDADLLDGNHASDFASSSHNHDGDYVELTGDTMSGPLIIDESDTTDKWLFRVDNNGSNFSGFWSASQDIQLYLRDDAGNVRVQLRPDARSLFYDGLEAANLYDSDNTSYYVNPASTSNLQELEILRNSSNYTVNLTDAHDRAGLMIKSSTNFDSKLAFSSGANSIQYIQALNNAHTTGRDIGINPFGGNVGIGTTSPGARLHVSSGTANEDCVVIIESDTDNNDETSNPRLELRQDAGGVVGRLGYRNNTNSLELINQYAEALYLGTSNTTDLTILSNGKVGIGTTSPNQKLTIKGTDQYVAAEQTNYVWGGTTTIGVRMGTDATAGLLDFRRWTGSATTHGTALITQANLDGGYGLDFRVDTKSSNTLATTSRMFLSASGEVGIGTTSPSQKLHVSSGDQSTARIRLSNTNTSSGGDNIELVAGVHNVTQDGFSIYNASGGVTQFVIQGGGNVGIGKEAPSEALDVDGSITSNATIWTGYDAGVTNSISCSGWFRSSGSTGWYNATYGGGIYMVDSTWVRAYNNKKFFADNTIESNSGMYAPIFYDRNNTGYFFNGDASKDNVDLVTGSNYAINVLGTISGGHRKHGNLETPEMQFSVGGSTDLNWKKLFDVVTGDASYSGWGAEIEITDFSGNFGSATYSGGELYKGALSIYHWGGTGTTPETPYANIPYALRNNVRWYKIQESGQNRYQLQVKSVGNYQQLYIKVKPGIGNQVADIISYANDTNGATSGGTAYTSTQAVNFNHEFAGGIWTNDGRIIGWKNAYGSPYLSSYYGSIFTSTSFYVGSPFSTTTQLYAGPVSGTIYYDRNNTTYYVDPNSTGDSIRVAGDVVAYYSSDKRLKDNIKPIENALDKVKAISGVTFEWNEKSHKTTGKKDVGVVAQEIEAVLPELVETRTNGYKAVDYQKLTAVLIESVKELTAKVEALENKQCNCK